MLFNSTEFLIFLSVTFALYWLVPQKQRVQNVVLVVISCFFYGWWDWRFLGLMVGSVLWTYFMALLQEKWKRQGEFRRGNGLILWSGVLPLLGVLFFFKYYNFFIDSINCVFGMNLTFLRLVLPIGLSFYTFMAIGYLADVYHDKISAERDLLSFSIFLMFFPQIVAGPIGRASDMMPQIRVARRFNFDLAMQGLCLIAYGLFKKMVVSDLLSLYVTKVFERPELYCSVTCILGAIFFSIQIYCDFSGYSDVARGVAQLFGIRLMLNFNHPYLATSFSGFWRRWHISLSTWFRDYVYIPLGGSRVPFWKVLRNLWIVFLLSGLWHGAAWTFVIWGGLHALFQTLGMIKRKVSRIPLPQKFSHTVLGVLTVNLGVTFAWIFFKANTFHAAMTYIGQIFRFSNVFSFGGIVSPVGGLNFLFMVFAIVSFLVMMRFSAECTFKSFRMSVLTIVVLMLLIVFLSPPTSAEFIYALF